MQQEQAVQAAAMELVRTEFRAMGSNCEIVAASSDGDKTRHAMGLAAREVLRIEHKYSRYREDWSSIVYCINQASGSHVVTPCDPETVYLLDMAESFYKLSNGLFDITSGILRRAWDFSSGRIPTEAELAPLLALIGWNKVEYDRKTIRLSLNGMEIDFGGLGKEYAADCAAAMLKRNGVEHGYVNLGGDIRVVGPRPGGDAWRFGVQDPRIHDAVIGNIELSSGGLVTSGDYVKFIEKDGARFSHILNPRTGISARCWRSVSVVGVSTLLAGAYATIAMLKEGDAVPFLNEQGCRYLLVDAEGRCTADRTKPE